MHWRMNKIYLKVLNKYCIYKLCQIVSGFDFLVGITSLGAVDVFLPTHVQNNAKTVHSTGRLITFHRIYSLAGLSAQNGMQAELCYAYLPRSNTVGLSSAYTVHALLDLVNIYFFIVFVISVFPAVTAAFSSVLAAFPHRVVFHQTVKKQPQY